MIAILRMLGVLALAAALSACQERSDADAVAEARKLITQQKPAAATLELKSLLQRSPESSEARFLLGRLLFAAGDALGAEAELRRALVAGHDRDLVLPQLAATLMAAGKPADLVREFGTVQLTDADADIEFKSLLAAALLAERQYDQAEQAVNKVLQLKPEHGTARLLQAKLLADRGDRSAAMAMTERLIAAAPGNAAAWQFKADLLAAGDRAAQVQALDAYRQALAIRPDLQPAHSALLTLLLTQGDLAAAERQWNALKLALPGSVETLYFEAVLAAQKGQPVRTREITQSLLRRAPDNPRLLTLAGRAEMQLRSWTQAEALLGKAVALVPAEASPRRMLAEVQVSSGQADKALATLKPLLEAGAPDGDVLAVAGQIQLAQRDYKAAEASLLRAARLKPGDAKVATALALTHLRMGRTDAGLAELEAAARADRDGHADLALIEAHLQRQDVPAAMKAIDALALKLPALPLADLLRGRVALLQKNAALARSHFEAALKKDADSFATVADLVRLDVAEGKTAEARARLEALVQRQPDLLQARMALAELTAVSGGSASDVAGLLEQAIKIRPGDPGPRAALVDHYLGAGDAKAALTAAQGAVAAFPSEAGLLQRLGRAQAATGDLNQAISSYGKLIAMQPASASAHLLLAEAQAAHNQVSAANNSVRRALELDPKSIPAHITAIRLALQAKQPARAMTLTKAVQSQWPGEAIGHVLEGDVELAQGNVEAATAAFRRAVGKNQPAEAAVRLHVALTRAGKAPEAEQWAQTWLNQRPEEPGMLARLGDVALEQKRLADAELQYQTVVRLQPNNAMALNNLAYVLLQQKKPGAVVLAEKAVKLAPGRAALMDTLALGYAQDKRLEQALQIQQQVVALSPTNPNFRLNLARMQTQSGHNEAARLELSELAKLGDAFPGQAEVASLQKVVGSASGGSAQRPLSATPTASFGLRQLASKFGLPLGAALALAASLLLLIAAMRPAQFKVSRTITIDAPAAQVFHLLQDLRTWEDWSTDQPFRPGVTRRYPRNPSGLGAVCDWSNKRRTSAGSLEIFHLAPPSRLAVEMNVSQPAESRQMAEFTLVQDTAQRTTVSWLTRGDAPFRMRLACVLRGVDRHIGRQIAANLARLKDRSEQATRAGSPVAGAEGLPAHS